MQGVGPGTVIDRRFTLTERVATGSGAARWRAEESNLARQVTILLLPSDDPRATAVLDAARMAAGVTSPALVQIIDVGTDGPVAYVVEESLATASSVADLVALGGLPADEMRRIAGETAGALATAATRGLHHVRLTPEEVWRTPEGAVKVRGLATAAALARVSEHGQSADLLDTRGVVAVLYAGLTGLWPLPDIASDLPLAPVYAAGIVPASDLAAGIPRDIDALCTSVLAETGGPTDVAALARELAPWSSRPVVGRSTLPGHDDDSVAASATLAPDTRPRPVGPTASSSSSARASQAGSPRTGSSRRDTDVIATGTGASTTAASGPGASTGAGVGRPVGAASAAPAGGGAAAAAVRAVSPPSRPAQTGTRREVELEPPGPGMPAEPLDHDQSKLALGIVAGFVLLSLVIGLWGVLQIGSHSDVLAPGPSASASEDAGAAAGASAAPGTTKLAILSADGFDPEGDKVENNDQAPRVFDGAPDTAWTTEGYYSANFGGLQPGAGVTVDIGPNVTPHTVKLLLNLPATVTVYVNSQRSLDGAISAGTVENANGEVSFTVPADAGAKQYVIVYFTSLTKDSDGFFQARLAEVSVFS